MIGGDHCEKVSGRVELAETFTVRTDQGSVFSVHGTAGRCCRFGKNGTGDVNEESPTARDALPMWEGEDPRAWDVCCLLHAQAAG